MNDDQIRRAQAMAQSDARIGFTAFTHLAPVRARVTIPTAANDPALPKAG